MIVCFLFHISPHYYAVIYLNNMTDISKYATYRQPAIPVFSIKRCVICVRFTQFERIRKIIVSPDMKTVKT